MFTTPNGTFFNDSKGLKFIDKCGSIMNFTLPNTRVSSWFRYVDSSSSVATLEEELVTVKCKRLSAFSNQSTLYLIG